VKGKLERKNEEISNLTYIMIKYFGQIKLK